MQVLGNFKGFSTSFWPLKHISKCQIHSVPHSRPAYIRIIHAQPIITQIDFFYQYNNQFKRVRNAHFP